MELAEAQAVLRDLDHESRFEISSRGRRTRKLVGGPRALMTQMLRMIDLMDPRARLGPNTHAAGCIRSAKRKTRALHAWFYRFYSLYFAYVVNGSEIPVVGQFN